MSWTLTAKHIRPNTDVEFYKAEGSERHMNDSDRSYVQSTYKDTGKIVETSVSLSDNQLELTKTIVFDSEDSFKLYYDDTIYAAWRAARDTYNTANNITVEIEKETT